MLQPLMEEFRLRIFRSPDLSVFLVDLLSDGDSAYSIANFVWNFGMLCVSCSRVLQSCVAVMGEQIILLYSIGNVFIPTVLLLALVTRLCVMHGLVEHNHGCRVMESWPHCMTVQQSATLCNTLQRSATHIRPVLGLVSFMQSWSRNTLQRPATLCNTLQHTRVICL